MRAENATAARNAEAAVAMLRQAAARLVAAAGEDRALMHLMVTARRVSAGTFNAGDEPTGREGE